MAMHFNKVAAQGELTITRIKKMPKKTGERVAPVNGKVIVGHSETGHFHVIEAKGVEFTRVNEFLAYLKITVATELTHQRDHDTHAPIALQPGMYEVRVGREFDPFEEVIRASAD